MLKPEHNNDHLIVKEYFGSSKTLPDIFIIESLDKKDENHHRYEGRILFDILRIANKNPKYIYVNTLVEFEAAMILFYVSRYRYLHISCHGSEDGKVFIGERSISYAKFANLMAGRLKIRRLFLSSCLMGNDLLFSALKAQNKGAHSLVGIPDEINFDTAIAFYSSLYISLFNENDIAINRKRLSLKLEKLCDLFDNRAFASFYDPKKQIWNDQTFGV